MFCDRSCIKHIQTQSWTKTRFYSKYVPKLSFFCNIVNAFSHFLCITKTPHVKLCEVSCLKPLHTIDKVSVNASILSKNQEICNKTNLWKCQLIPLFLLRENSKNAFSIFVFILSNGQSFRIARRKLIIRSYFTNYSKTITHQAEIFQGKLSTIVIFIPWSLCVNLWTFLFFGLTNVVQGL